MIKNLIRYQQLDISLLKLQKELNNSNVDPKKEKLQKYRKEKQARLIKLDEEAIKNIENLNKITEISNKGINLSTKFIKNDLEKLSIEELEELLQKCNKTISDFDLISTKLKAISKNVEKTLDEFKKTKKEVIQSGKMINEINSTAEQEKESKKPEIDKIIEEMTELEKNISSELIKKYKELKHNKIFPVLAKLVDKSCGSCGMKLSEKNIEEIDAKNYSICETCHRFVIKTK